MGKPIRIDKFLADAGLGTRSEVKKLLRQGEVLVDGRKIVSPDAKVTGEEEILCHGRRVCQAPAFVYYLLHKPQGYLSATEDKKGPTILDLLPTDSRRNLFPVGRLDKDTEGLLLVTDDGAFAHELLSPHHHVDKTYYARVRPPLSPDVLPLFEKGLDIGDEKPTLPARLEILSSNEDESEIRLTIQEGRYHQVKRMVAAVGSEVVYLKRLSMGGYTLPEDLPVGSYIQLDIQRASKSQGLDGCRQRG